MRNLIAAIRNKWLLALLILAFLRGANYALNMPPWGLLDEEQHFDYIMKVAQTGRPPVTGRDTLDPALAQSILDSGRHQKFHWPAPASSDMATWGLEGFSYEGYQGPLFYYLCAPFYWIIPGTLIDKLFVLRLLMIALSLVTVWAAAKITQELFPTDPWLPFWVCLLIISIPERTSSTGRLTNDVLLEVIAVLFVWLCTRAARRGISWKSALGLGLLAGLGLLTKVSFAGILVLLPLPFLLAIRRNGTILKALLTGTAALAVSGPFLYQSYRLYGDPTGWQGFVSLYSHFAPLWNPPFRLATIAQASWKIFGSFWLVWWNGSDAVYSPWLQVFWAAMFILTLAAVWGFIRFLIGRFQPRRNDFWILAAYLVTTLAFLLLAGVGYFQGKFPVIQGRFLLPILFPVVLIFVLGLMQYAWGRSVLLAVCVILLVMDTLSLFGNLLPYHYYQSAFYQDGQMVAHTWPGFWQAAGLFLSRYLSDKPAWAPPAAFISLLGYGFLLVYLLRIAWPSSSTPGLAQSPAAPGEQA